jgi:hypothetical protein
MGQPNTLEKYNDGPAFQAGGLTNNALNEVHQINLAHQFTNPIEQLPSNGVLYVPPPDFGPFTNGWESKGAPVPNFVSNEQGISPHNELPKLISQGVALEGDPLSSSQQTTIKGIENQYNQQDRATEKQISDDEKKLQAMGTLNFLNGPSEMAGIEKQIQADEGKLHADWQAENRQIWGVLDPTQQGMLQGAFNVENQPPELPKNPFGNLGPLGV